MLTNDVVSFEQMGLTVRLFSFRDSFTYFIHISTSFTKRSLNGKYLLYLFFIYSFPNTPIQLKYTYFVLYLFHLCALL